MLETDDLIDLEILARSLVAGPRSERSAGPDRESGH